VAIQATSNELEPVYNNMAMDWEKPQNTAISVWSKFRLLEVQKIMHICIVNQWRRKKWHGKLLNEYMTDSKQCLTMIGSLCLNQQFVITGEGGE